MSRWSWPLAARPLSTASKLDAGLQPERTTMSWSRTCLALVVVSAVFLRWLPHYGASLLVLPLVTVAAAMLIAVSQRSRTRRGVQGIEADRLAADPLAVVLLVGLSLSLGIAGVAFVLAAP